MCCRYKCAHCIDFTPRIEQKSPLTWTSDKNIGRTISNQDDTRRSGMGILGRLVRLTPRQFGWLRYPALCSSVSDIPECLSNLVPRVGKMRPQGRLGRVRITHQDSVVDCLVCLEIGAVLVWKAWHL